MVGRSVIIFIKKQGRYTSNAPKPNWKHTPNIREKATKTTFWTNATYFVAAAVKTWNLFDLEVEWERTRRSWLMERRDSKRKQIYQLYTYVYTHYICNRIIHTGSSLNILFFFQEFSKVCQLSLACTRLLLVVQNITSQ